MFLSEHFPNQVCVKSDETSAITLTFSEPDVRIIHAFKDKFSPFGLKIDCSDRTVCVTRIPSCFLLREENDLKNFRPSPLIKLTRSLVEDVITTIKQTGMAGTAILPKTLIYVLASRACRGAVKFGDSLTPDVCQQLLRQLGQCQLPFQCAHGRPSLSPLADLGLLRLSSPQQPSDVIDFKKLRDKCKENAATTCQNF